MDVEFYGFSAAAIGALIMGKVVIILDKTPIGKLYLRKALYKNIIAKSIIYTLALTVVLFIENLIHSLSEGKAFVASIINILEHRDPLQFRLTLIASFFSLLSYNIIIGLRDTMEKGALVKLFFKNNQNNNHEKN